MTADDIIKIVSAVFVGLNTLGLLLTGFLIQRQRIESAKGRVEIKAAVAQSTADIQSTGVFKLLPDHMLPKD